MPLQSELPSWGWRLTSSMAPADRHSTDGPTVCPSQTLVLSLLPNLCCDFREQRTITIDSSAFHPFPRLGGTMEPGTNHSFKIYCVFCCEYPAVKTESVWSFMEGYPVTSLAWTSRWRQEGESANRLSHVLAADLAPGPAGAEPSELPSPVSSQALSLHSPFDPVAQEVFLNGLKKHSLPTLQGSAQRSPLPRKLLWSPSNSSSSEVSGQFIPLSQEAFPAHTL